MTKIILFRGKAGVGKTTLSNKVSRRLNIPIIRKDDIYDSIAENENNHKLRNAICEKIIRKLIKTGIENNTTLIIDNPYHHHNQIDEFQEWLKKQGVELISILVICSNENIWKERFNKRKLYPKSNQLITDFDALKIHYNTLETEPIKNELVLDSVNEIEQLAQDSIQYIQNKNCQNRKF